MIASIMRRTVVLSTLMVAVVAVGATAAAASPVRRGATYDGLGRQPHFALTPGGGAPDGSFVVRLVAARSGRRVKIYVWGLSVACSSSSYRDAMADPGWTLIRRDGTFRARLGANAGALTFGGRFLAHGRARGRFRYRGGGCNADGIWTTQVKPPAPPVQRFVGTTDQGTQVTFERTIEPHPHVTRFDFGSLQTNCGPRTVATGTELGPPFDVQFTLPVHQNSFAGDYFDEAFDISITGSFSANGPAGGTAIDSASGTVNYGDRGGCNIVGVHWTAQPLHPGAG